MSFQMIRQRGAPRGGPTTAEIVIIVAPLASSAAFTSYVPPRLLRKDSGQKIPENRREPAAIASYASFVMLQGGRGVYT